MDKVTILKTAARQVTEALLDFDASRRDLQMAEAQLAALKNVILDDVTRLAPDDLADILEGFADLGRAIERIKASLGL